MQKFKNIGGKVIFEQALKSYLKSINEDLLVEIKPIMHPDLIDKLERADKIKTLRFIRSKIPKSAEDIYYYKSNENDEIKEERQIKVGKSEGIFEKLKHKLKGFIENKESEYLEIEGEKYETLKVTVEEKGSQSTLTIGENNKVREKRPVLPEEIRTEGGHPVQDSIFEIAVDYLEPVLEKDKEQTPED